METEKTTQVVDEKPKKQPKRFTMIQSIILLFLSFAITSGTGYAVGKFYFWTDIDMKRVNEQFEYYKERVKMDPTNLENRIVLGYTYYLKGNNSEAIKEFNYVLDQDKEYYDAYYNLGLVYLDMERYDDALSMFSKNTEIAPKDFKGFVQKGIAYRHLKMYEEARETLAVANKLNPASADIIYQTGLVAEEQKKYEEAVLIYKEALEYDPLFEEAVNALDRLKDYDTGTEGDS